MRKRWPFFAIAIGWTLAAIVLFLSGMWVANTNRYDDCIRIPLGPQLGWFCPDRQPVPGPVTEGDRA